MLNWIYYEQSSLRNHNSYSSWGLRRVAPLKSLQWLSSAGKDGTGQEDAEMKLSSLISMEIKGSKNCRSQPVVLDCQWQDECNQPQGWGVIRALIHKDLWWQLNYRKIWRNEIKIDYRSMKVLLLDTYERKNSMCDGPKSNAVTIVGILSLLPSFTDPQLLNRGRGWVLLRMTLQCCLKHPSSLPCRILWLFLGWLCTRERKILRTSIN